ncbi:MAG: hypothetical protein PHQ03_00785 [Methylococcales bacterium]|nr:hypothetical protein [Methylococcales bacterium]
MCSFSCSDIQLGLNTVGLLFDIAGAWIVAWEVVRQYRGEKAKVKNARCDGSAEMEETDAYKEWEILKYSRMKLGLGFLTIGFLLQLLSHWIVKLAT